MKKLFFLLGGIIVLTSCSEDMIIDEQETDLFTSIEESGSNYGISSYTGVVGDSKYKSPWNLDSLRNVFYQFSSNTVNTSGLYVRVTPYIGLAYYDGSDNGMYNTSTGPVNLASDAYPNLYANGHEYGNYVKANPIVLGNPTLTAGSWYTHEIVIQSREDHCPLINIPVVPSTNLYGIGFNIMNNATVQPSSILGYSIPPLPAGTSSEERLLRRYGKVFYYKVEYGTSPTTFNSDAYYVLSLEADMSVSGWSMVPGTIAGLPLEDSFNSHLYFHDNGGSGSREVIVDPDSFSGKLPEYKESGIMFNTTATGWRTIRTMPAGFPTFTPGGIIKPGAEPRGVSIHFE